uniref:Uncharacterized protein n=1 Tax=Arundo donax TaxID=35708 RepID=A0A0A9AAE0_ARUDO
MEKRPMALP